MGSIPECHDVSNFGGDVTGMAETNRATQQSVMAGPGLGLGHTKVRS